MHDVFKVFEQSLVKLAVEIRALTQAVSGSKSSGAATKQDLDEMEKRIMATQAEIAGQLRKAVDTINKIGNETDVLIQKVKDLQAAVDNQDNATPELIAAAQAVSDQLEIVDDKVPETQPVPTP